MIHVIATVHLHPGQREAFLAEFRQIVPLVLAEAGCQAYGPAIDLASGVPAQAPVRENAVTIVEQWESLPHLQAHLVAPHMTAYRPKVKAFVDRVELLVLQPA